ncbi:hypothetical protein AVEN_209905-1 [Araneus ventricosus]|uniref:Uncharacterized protein n=1 Tax=Araneus ventricosus TaxID=182803 RepID=A0A4Y2PRH7_ARAVE|nr:hypothetical protein AVEN_209905-1 [Araneus ventricosus]
MSFGVLVLAKKTFFLPASSLVCRIYDSKMKPQKRKEKAPLIAIPHKNRTLSAQRDAIPSVFPGASEANKNLNELCIAARLCTEEVSCSNSPRVCAMAATFWRNTGSEKVPWSWEKYL